MNLVGGYTLQLQLGEKTVLSHRLHALFIFAPAAENCKVQREIQMSCVHEIEMHLQFPHNIFAVRRLLTCVRTKNIMFMISRTSWLLANTRQLERGHGQLATMFIGAA